MVRYLHLALRYLIATVHTSICTFESTFCLKVRKEFKLYSTSCKSAGFFLGYATAIQNHNGGSALPFSGLLEEP